MSLRSVSGDSSAEIGPKRSESITASGRAFMVKMSRRMPPDASGRALKWLDIRGVIVRLDLEGAGPALANVDDSGVFSRPLHNAIALRGQPPEVDAGRLVRAVLTPHDAVNSEFGEAWDAAEGGEDALVFVWRNAVLRQQLRGDLSGRRGRNQ